MNIESSEPFPNDQQDRLSVRSDVLPIEFVPSERSGTEIRNPLADKIFIYSIHGGDVIPAKYFQSLSNIYPDESDRAREIHRCYSIEKDWGANQIAQGLSQQLGLAGYWRINIARVLMDFGRFPGITQPGASHLDRYAINFPFSYALGFEEKRQLLASYYDAISKVFEKETEGKILKLGIHTYDLLNPRVHFQEVGTVRPDVSLIFRPTSFQETHKMPHGIFDPLFPDQLAEVTADRRLTSRVSLNLEKAGIAVSHNFPYSLPDGSVEVRSQIWTFFKFLKNTFDQQHGDMGEDPAYTLVWDMLLDTNLRSSQSEVLRSYLHMFRNPPKESAQFFKTARVAYQTISGFMNNNREELLLNYRNRADRLSTLAVEVRKDLVWKFKDIQTWEPIFGEEGLRRDNVDYVSGLLADAIHHYFREDKSVKSRRLT